MKTDEKKKKAPKKQRAAYPFSVRRQAFGDYLENTPLKEISKRRGVPMSTLNNWIKVYNWSSERKSLQKKSMDSIIQTYAQVVEKNQLATLNRKLKVASYLDQSIRAKLVDKKGKLIGLSVAQLRDLADAFKKNTEVDAKLLGMLAPANQINVMAGKGAILNVGIKGSPVASVPDTPSEKKSIPADVSNPPYERQPDDPF